MSLFEAIKEVQEEWGKKFAVDLNASLNAALRKSGNPQEADLHFEENIVTTPNGVKVQILASEDYWIYIEKGRRKGVKQPPSEALGKKWQNKNNIDARRVLAEIEIKYKAKKGLARKDRTLNRPKKTLNYDAAAKRLSFILARSIKKKGIEPRPYLEKVINDGRAKDLKKALSEVIGKEVILELNLKNSNIKLTI